MAMAPAKDGNVANKCARCAREQGNGGVARFSAENNAVLDDIQGTPFDGATEAKKKKGPLRWGDNKLIPPGQDSG
jgi:hypothetical protein